MMNDMVNPENNFTIRIGKYFFDSLSMVGRVVGINAWNFSLTGPEMKSLTNCSSIVIKDGNMINKDTVWHRTAKLVQEHQLDMKDLHCDKSQQTVTVFIPVNRLAY